ncbi:glycine-rich domain-containing protein-like [Massilia sp. NR 4-1]|uniref:glycine-rich domain-containing protein n=1 Tax=Massilia sp. NR 4-1 TaxID=1678028 RepID=UPI00067BEEA4|nr:glycine-rich domain-containing protein-like [Massilia sp. NR 4-1]AKU22188.1 hypothetical protein ACZ75_12635 [Massilia sp. NR 4-1]
MNATDFKAIAELDLDPIKVKLMHVESGEGWSLERANAVEFEYRRFLYLMKKFPKEQTAPLMDVDIFWHYHILDTMKYAVDCQAVFGYFLHHFPYIGLRGEDDEVAHARVGQRMKELYEETFNEPYVRSQAAWSGAAVQQDDARTAWSGAAVEAKAAWSGAAVQAQTAWSGAAVQKETQQAQTAWSGAAVQAQTAWSGAAVQKETPQAQTAWSGAAVQAQTAWSGAAVQKETPQAQTAWSGAAVQAQTAWSGAAVQAGAAETQTAWSGAAVQQATAPAQTAWSGAAVSQPTTFYTNRPALPQQA